MWVQGNADKSLALSPEQFEKKYFELIKKIINHNLNNYVKISNLNLKYLFELVLSWERSFMYFRSPCGAGLDMIDSSVTGDVYPYLIWLISETQAHQTLSLIPNRGGCYSFEFNTKIRGD